MPLQPKVTLTENSALAQTEFQPTAQQRKAVSSSCIANALTGLTGLTTDQKSQLKDQITSLQGNLSTAIDLVKKKMARMEQQKQILQKERDQIGESKSNFSKFYGLAAKAIVNCDDAATAAQNAKSAVDMVFSREIEIQYRQNLLTSLNAALNGTLDEYSSAMDTLDKMILAIS